MLYAEIDYILEGRNADRFRRNFKCAWLLRTRPQLACTLTAPDPAPPACWHAPTLTQPRHDG